MGASDQLGRTFYGILGYDAVDAMMKMEADDGQSSRRDFVRAAFAAIEGWLWNYRQEVQDIVGSCRAFSALEESALAEISYAISDTGALQEQARYLPITNMFRFVTRIAEAQCGQQLVDFSSADWANFKQSIAIRNRITHPKSIEDLMLSDADIGHVKSALSWLFGVIVSGTEKLKLILEDHVQAMREVADALLAGDPATLALYNAVLENRDQ
jgi:hypothetical protein